MNAYEIMYVMRPEQEIVEDVILKFNIRHYNGYNKKWLIDASSDSWLKTIVEVS